MSCNCHGFTRAWFDVITQFCFVSQGEVLFNLSPVCIAGECCNHTRNLNAAYPSRVVPFVFLPARIQLLYPVLMIVMVSRTFASLVRTADHIVFKSSEDHVQDTANESGGNFFSSARSFGAKIGTSLRDDHSMFAWADKGQWESVEIVDKKVQRQRDWFRIGFEPIFVDFTGKGFWFVVYTLIEVRAIRIVSVQVQISII